MRNTSPLVFLAALWCLLVNHAILATEAPDLSVLEGIQIDAKGGRLTISGDICLDDGILEYLAVVEGGKEYESAIALKCKPAGLHAALLLIGAQPGELDPRYREDAPPLPEEVQPPKQPGTPVRLTVRWQDTEGDHEVPATRLLISRNTGASPPSLPWIFTGSYFVRNPETGQELYMAELHGTLAAVYYDPSAILNLPAAQGNPYRGEKTGFALNTDLVPPRGTPVLVDFEVARDWKPPAEKPPEQAQ